MFAHRYLCAVIATVSIVTYAQSAPTWVKSSRDLVSDFFLAGRYSTRWLSANASVVPPLWQLLRTHTPRVSVLGSARMMPDNYWYAQAYQFGKLCAQHGMTVITGGGPGIMEAAANGAFAGNPLQRPLGIGVHHLDKNFINRDQTFAHAVNFETRQWLLLNFSCALVYFPGGVGTLFELTQALTLIDTRYMRKLPIVLVGKKHWHPLINWLTHLATNQHLVNTKTANLMLVVNSAQEAFSAIQNACRNKEEIFNLQQKR